MKITEVRVKLMSDRDEKLLAFCSVTFNNEFVIRDLKVISGSRGPFVAMPSRKLMDRCPKCRNKNHLRSRFCNECGTSLNPQRAGKDERGRAKHHTDIAHPINSACREMIQDRILEAYEKEVQDAKNPAYSAAPKDSNDYKNADDYDEEFFDDKPLSADDVRQNTRENTESLRQPKPPQEEKGDSFDAGIFS